jgi:hypothetical protein
MNINDIITIEYESLKNHCNFNIIRRKEIQLEGIKDIEDVDILHTMIIRWLKKYKKSIFNTDDEIKAIKSKIAIEFTYEKNKFTKMKKKNNLYFVSFEDNNIIDKD